MKPDRRKVILGLGAGLLGLHFEQAMASSGFRVVEELVQHWLTDMGFTDADAAEVYQIGLKDCGSPWLHTAFSVDNGRLNNPSNGIQASIINKNFTNITPTNTRKWVVTEAVQGAPDYSRDNTLLSEIASLCPGLVGKVNLHLLFGQNIYNPAWLNTLLNGTPSQLNAMVAYRLAEAVAQWPTDNIYRIDVLNEVTNSALTTDVSDSRGWRTSANCFYQAAQANGGETDQWIWDAFTGAKTNWPSGLNAWADFAMENPVNPLVFPSLSAPFGGQEGPFASNNEFSTNMQRDQRLRYEVRRAQYVGNAPIDLINYQYHINAWAPPFMEGLEWSFMDYNRWGVTPCVGEFNVTDGGTAGTTFSPHMASQPLAVRDRYSSWVAAPYLKAMFNRTPAEELSCWVNSSNIQAVANLSTEYPLMTVAKMVAVNAVTPGSRTIKRDGITSGRFATPKWVTQTGSPAVSIASNRTAITGAGNLQVGWPFWYSDPSMGRPLSSTNYILDIQFQTSSAPAANTTLFGLGNATSGTPTNFAKLSFLANNLVHLDIVVGGVNQFSQDIGVINSARDHRVIAQIAGTGVKWSLDGAPVQSGTAGGSFSDQTSVYILSDPDSTHFDAKVSYVLFGIHHGPDYATDEALRQLSVPTPKYTTLMQVNQGLSELILPERFRQREYA